MAFFIAVLAFSCKKSDNSEKEIAAIPVSFELKRFDEAFANASPEQLPQLKAAFPYFFPEQFNDSVWINRMQDSLQQELLNEVQKAFPSVENEKEELKQLFQHAKYYFPDFKEPTVISLTSDVDYNNRVIYADSLLLIALDNYLGPGHRFYNGIQQYLKKNFTPEMIAVDAAGQIARSRMQYPNDRTLLGQMILHGKELYLKDLLIPFKTDAQKMGYTPKEIEWAIANEGEIWRYFIENNLLYDTSLKTQERFVREAPFSKFYLELDNEAPGRLGQFMGWQIVRAYMLNNNVPLQQMLNAPADEIFKKSRFKPKK